jgi:hypothetical protein
MFRRHPSRLLAAYIDGQLSRRQTQRAELHLEQCAQCRAECEQIKFGMTVVDQLPVVEAPAAIWTSIAAALETPRTVRPWRWAFAAIVVLALAGATYWRFARQPGTQWIETNSVSSTVLKIGEIGWVEVAPNTRVRVVTDRPDQHRLALERGEIRAKISAPPRLFFVDTASGTAVDLGCEYTLTTGEDGDGLLRVTKGWVSFQSKGLESLVPAGASCRTRPLLGPGIPYFDDAPESVKQAGSSPLSIVLAEARVRDTLTLWHLLSRVDESDRALVYDRIAALSRVPAGVSREQALALDPETLRRWKEELAWTW